MITLTPDQQQAADDVWQFLVTPDVHHHMIKGHAGCGKSTLTRHILDNLPQQLPMMRLIMGLSHDQDLEVHVCAPTNPAARVIADMVGTEPKTVQSLFGMVVMNDYKTGGTKLVKTKNYKVHENCLIIIDESSFIGPFLRDAILEATPNCKVLFILDPYQLAPPKEHFVPVAEMEIGESYLTTINRNAGPIADLAGEYREVVMKIAAINKELREERISKPRARDAIKAVQWPEIKAHGDIIQMVNGSRFEALVKHRYRKGSNDYLDTKIVAWTNSRVIEYNDYIRNLRGLGQRLEMGEVVVSNKALIMGQKVMLSTDQKAVISKIEPGHIRQDVMGSMVEVQGVPARFFMPDNVKEASTLSKKHQRKNDWKPYFEIKDQWADFRPLHASTVHKAQGATYDYVFVDLEDIGECFVHEDVARMMYVALSRPSKTLVLYGELPDRYNGKVYKI